MNWYLLLAVLAGALVIWSLVSIAMSRSPVNEKILWFALVVLVPIIGPVIYYVVGNKG